MSTLSERSFRAITEMFHRVSGIRLNDSKRPLVIGRLQKLASEKGVHNLDQYIDQVVRGQDPAEVVRVVDRLTTNETYFFREPQHFNFLAELLAARRGQAASQPFRVWSAASSSGEEAYSIAMLLADKLGTQGWEIIGTDLSTAMVESARRALYPMSRAEHTPRDYLKRYCLKGTGPYDGELLIAPELRANVRFMSANLTQTLPDIGSFDVIFLRNVLIYFDMAAKAQIVRRVSANLKPSAYLFTGHAESLSNLDVGLRCIKPAIYART